MKKYLILPNFFTGLSIFCGWISIIMLLNGNFYYSFAVVLIGFIFDIFDGFLASRLNQESDFGKNLDSFADVFLYLFYPALTWYFYFNFQNYLSVVIIYIFILCGLFRLSRLNTEGFYSIGKRTYYLGLPVVFSHLIIWIFIILNSLGYLYNWIGYILIITFSLLMVSRILFPKPKSVFSISILVSIIFLAVFTSFYLS